MNAISEFLRLNVPPEIEAIAKRGGLNDLDIAWLKQEENDDRDDLIPLNVLMRADEFILFPEPKTRKEVDQVLQAQLVFRKTIALMAFFPGGIRIFGWHFCSQIPGFMQTEDEDDQYSQIQEG